MSDTHASSPAMQAPAKLEAIDILTILLRRKKFVLGVPTVVALCVAVASIFIPNTYKANTRILPPQQAQSGAAALMAQLGGVAGAAASAAGVKNPNDLYLGMLKSRTIADRLVTRFDLKRIYDVEYFEYARKKLEENTTISSGKDGLINIEVEDRDRKRVAEIANAYAEELLRLTKVLAVTEASQRRMFFERQLRQAKDNLAEAEMSLKGALDKHGVVSVDSQSRAIVETVARLRAQIAAKEIQLNSMQAFVTQNNQEYKRVNQELVSMRAELARQENGSSASVENADNVDPAGLKNIKILRDVKYFQMLYEMLSKQYEIARLDESKDASIIQVLDEAQEPERKFKPRRAIITILAGFVTFLMAVFWVLSTELFAAASNDPDRARRFEAFRAALSFRRG